MKNIVQFKRVTKEFVNQEVKVKVLKGIDFDIKEGEILLVIGSSGAGKSTILNILGGLDTPTDGEVIVENQNISNYKEKQLSEFRAKKVGIIFQSYNLIPNLTALENVIFGSEVKTGTLDAREILGKVGLGDKCDKFPATLSGGEQQRVAIARAVAKNPLMILCDEPTGALDYETSKAALKLLEDLNKELNKTIILVTHNLALSPMADRILTVKSGKVESIEANTTKKSVAELEW